MKIEEKERGLSGNERICIIYRNLVTYIKENDNIHMDKVMPFFSVHYGLSEKTILKYINNLIELGYIKLDDINILGFIKEIEK